YPTLSPLPVPLRAIGGLLSAALSIRSSRDFRPPFSRGALPYGVRTFLNRGLRRIATVRGAACGRCPACARIPSKRSRHSHSRNRLANEANPRQLPACAAPLSFEPSLSSSP